jgi:hypothetical protein
MNSTREIRISEAVRQQFVGRSAELNVFYQRFAYRHMKNGVYYYGAGGLGKTWILEKIWLDNQDDPTRIVIDIIDFFDTKNHNVRGLQATIKSRLPNPGVFQPYSEVIEDLEVARSKNKHPGAITNLETRADKIFVECCRQAVIGQEVILLFDTFERVQQRRVGQWLLHEFLPNVRGLVVAIVGRPTPAPSEMPDNIVTYELQGLNLEAFVELVHLRLQSASHDVIESIHKHTGGSPLIANLILDLSEPQQEQFISQMSQLDKDKQIQGSSELQRWLIGQFVHPPSGRNRVIWAMAYLRRRFDVPILRYIVENLDKWFRPADYDAIFEELVHLIYVKKYPHQQSHLLHDKIQQMVTEYALPEVGIWEEFRADLYNLVVRRYYSETITLI